MFARKIVAVPKSSSHQKKGLQVYIHVLVEATKRFFQLFLRQRNQSFCLFQKTAKNN
jgi:hypothetical protein